MLEIQNPNEDIILSSDQNIIYKSFGLKSKNNISVHKNINFKYLILASDSENDVSFDIKGENVKGEIYAIFFGDNPLSSNIKVNILSSNSQISVYTISFIQTDKVFDVNGLINLGKDIYNSQGHLLEKNIILGTKVKIKAIPRLDVYSNDVKATHGLSIDRINEDEMFYLNSKGLDQNLSKKMIVSGNIKNILNKFENLSDTEKNKIENQILSKITN